MVDNVRLEKDPASEGWHLDKRIPVALLVVVCIQLASFVWWGAQLQTRVDALERIVLTQSGFTREASERLVRIETTTESMDRRLQRMEDSR